jgi:hypothetical protein
VEAGRFSMSAWEAVLSVDCERCGTEFATWPSAAAALVPLPEVLAAVNGHTCTEEKP